MLKDTSLGKQVVIYKIWDAQGRILYSSDARYVGQIFPIDSSLARAWQGTVEAEVSNLADAENIYERQNYAQLLQVYSPVRSWRTDRVIAVAELYQKTDDLQKEIGDAQWRSWLVVAAVTLIMYALLSGFVGRASTRIVHQDGELRERVAQLTALLAQNAELSNRVRRASARTTAINEGVLRRIGAELHDGPAQDLSLALLRLDLVAAHCSTCPAQGTPDTRTAEHMPIIQSALQRALQEIRAISIGLSVPHLDTLTLSETVTRVVRVHERRTGTAVAVHLHNLPDHAPLPVKITLYRVIQEFLTNAYRHAGGVGQDVTVTAEGGFLMIAVADAGPGFSGNSTPEAENHLGLVGMRERVTSLGGQFSLESIPDQGTTVRASLALAEGGDEA